MFSTAEYCDMILLYGENRGNTLRTQELYKERFPDRRLPALRTISDCVQRFRDNGNVRPTFEGRGAQHQRFEFEEQAMQLLEDNPTLSSRNIAREIGTSHMTVHRILQSNRLYPYHVQKVQQLDHNDFIARLQFCQWFRVQEARDPTFGEKIMFTDECCFTRDVNVWAGIMGNRIIGPFVLPPRLNQNLYREFLEDTIPEVLEDMDLATRRIMWFMHDGAPPYVTVNVRNYLNLYFPNRWLGRHGPIAWPPRSPDMNPVDYFFWGFMKNIVYATPLDTLEELQQKIIDAANEIRNGNYLHEVQNNLRRRTRACMLVNGGHFEHLL